MRLLTLIARVRRVLRKPPAHIARRIVTEARHRLDRFTQPSFGRRFGVAELVSRTQARDVDEIWERIQTASGWPSARRLTAAEYAALCPGDEQRILVAAERAVRHEIDLLGSGLVALGGRIDWHRDFKTGDGWPLKYYSRIDYINRTRRSDVKTAWELSRLQWLLPCGQAFILCGDERYAAAAREVLESWMDANPYCYGVNWGVTMEPALRIVTWTWLIHAFGASAAWQDCTFRAKLLCSLYLHAAFTERFIERTDVRGNHFTAEVAALTIAGAAFGTGVDAGRWLTTGVEDLEREMLLQVHPDGVNFEASVAYHRLVAEFFLYGALFADAAGLQMSAVYRERLAAMAAYAAAYTRDDGTTPLVGDADDGRTLPLGDQLVGDHRYLPGLIGLYLNDDELIAGATGSRAEACWLFGAGAAARLGTATQPRRSRAFESGGFYVLRDGGDHVFVDCGPLGLAGRGGHDHNDMLSFEAALDGKLLVCDRGTLVYTGDFEARNSYRSTHSHNTPQIDGAEINRMPNAEWLWALEYDAHPVSCVLTEADSNILFVGSHDGYSRLDGAPSPRRKITLTPTRHSLTVSDVFSGTGIHQIRIPMHLALGVTVERPRSNQVILCAEGALFEVDWVSAGPWTMNVEESSVSRSYGVVAPSSALVWEAAGEIGGLALTVSIRPLVERNLAS